MKGATCRFGMSGSKKKGTFSKSMSENRINKLIDKKLESKREKRNAQKAVRS